MTNDTIKIGMKPVHPGRLVRQKCLEPLSLSVTEAAKVLGVTRQTLNNLVNEDAGISPEMAICLEKSVRQYRRYVVTDAGRLRSGAGPQKGYSYAEV